MASDTYPLAYKRVRSSEGGYSNDKADPGGPTLWGVTHIDYDAYRETKGLPKQDVRKMTEAECAEIYKVRYWDKMRCDDLPVGVDYAIFDYGFNSGIGRAGKVLRRCLGMSDATSVITADVITKAKAVNQPDLICGICDERLRFLKSLKTWPVFGAGWGKRVAEVKIASLAIADKQPPIVATQSVGKGIVPADRTTQTTTGAVIVATTATVSHVSHYHPLIIGLCVIAAVLVAIAAFAFIGRRQAEKQEERI